MQTAIDKNKLQHVPVLLEEVIENLAIKPEGVYVDATFGYGGHSGEILKKLGENGQLIVIDKDPKAIAEAKSWHDSRLVIKQGSFIKMKEWLGSLGLIGKVSGIVLDLGVSSPQLDEEERGFSFMRDGYLDMRMNPAQNLTAAEWLNKAREEELAKIFKLYGEERFSKRIASAIVRERQQAPILTTKKLALIIEKAQPYKEKHKHPATRVFQAIRIFINDELNELRQVLEQSIEVLQNGGRLLVITFHSLEDRIVKEFIRRQVESSDIPSGVPLRQKELPVRLRRIGRALRANEDEIKRNRRSRSATLRVLEKIV